MSNIYQWSRTAALNNFNPPDGQPEGMNPADVNDCGRELMRAIREFYENPEFLNLIFGFTVTVLNASQLKIAGIDATSKFPVNRRIQLQGGATSPFGFVNNLSYMAPDSTLTVSLDGGVNVPAGTNTILCHIFATANSTAFQGIALNLGTLRLLI